MALRTLFLDRDGVINTRKNADYIRNYDEFEFCEGALSALATLTQKSLFDFIIIVTNQMGVAKGLMSLEDLEDIHYKMLADIEQAGGHIDAVFAAIGTKEDPRRKPQITMALEAQARFGPIDFANSFMVGDTASDLEFGARAEMQLVLIDTPLEDAKTISQRYPQAAVSPSLYHWVNNSIF